MTPNMENYLRRHGIRWGDIKYILRENGKTVICLDDGRREETYNTVKSLMDVLPDGEFICVNKGIVLAKRKIANVNGFVYTMSDGSEYIGRAHQQGGHMANIPNVITLSSRDTIMSPEEIFENYKALDDMPVAFGILNIIFNEDGRGGDLVFRYCNKKLKEYSGYEGPVEGKSFFEVHPNSDKRWLLPIADVAMNGIPRVVQSETVCGPGKATPLTVYCFQVAKNHCGCMLVYDSDTMDT